MKASLEATSHSGSESPHRAQAETTAELQRPAVPEVYILQNPRSHLPRGLGQGSYMPVFTLLCYSRDSLDQASDNTRV